MFAGHFFLCWISLVQLRGIQTQVIQSVQEATGRTFTVAGDSKLVWNPLPTLTLEQVTLSNTPNSQNPQMFQAEKIQIQIEWASLFKSPTRIPPKLPQLSAEL